MILVIYNSLFFLSLFIWLQVQNKEITISKYLVGVWLSSSILSIFFVNDWGPFYRLSLTPFLYLELCFLISIYPIYKFNDNCLDNIHIENPKILRFLIIFIAIIAILPFAENLIHIVTSYVSQDNSDIASIYDDKMSGDFDERKLSSWLSPIGRILNSITRRFWVLELLLLFYYLTRPKINNFILIGLGFASINPVLFSFAIAGRTDAAFYILFFIFYLILFKRYIPVKVFKLILLIGGIVGVGFIILIAILTTARFDNAGYTVFAMLNHYLGEGMVLFSDSMWNIARHTQGDYSFAYFKDLIGLDTFTNFLDRRNFWSESKIGISNFRFYTYIGAWFSDLGPFFTFLFTLTLSIFIRKITIKVKKISFVSLYIFVSFCYIILCGFTIYPYMVYSSSSNVMLGLIISCLLSFNFTGSDIDNKNATNINRQIV